MLTKVSIFSKQAIHSLCEALPKLVKLKNLDLSNNSLGNNELANIFEALSNDHVGPCKIRSLNVSQNNATPTIEHKIAGSDRFSDRLQRLIKSSHSL